MELADLQELIKHPDSLDENTLPLLKDLLEQYPYFQTAWVLYLKNLYKTDNPSFKEELRRGAFYVADLSVLFYYIEGDRFLIQKHKEVLDEAGDITSDRTLDLIDRFLSETPEQSAHAPHLEDASVPLEMPGDYTSVLLSEVTEEEKTEAKPLHGQELIDQFIEDSKMNPSEGILNLSLENESPTVQKEGEKMQMRETVQGTPEQENRLQAEESTPEQGNHLQAEESTPEQENHLQAEESTSEQENRLQAEESTPESIQKSEPSCEESSDEEPAPLLEDEEPEESYFTETLAKIYVRQQRYEKALEIIKKLNLKYPKKNAYFADQIRFLEKLIINAKSK